MGPPSNLVHRLAVAALLVLGAYQIALGAYFIAFRPALLPEDIRVIGTPQPPGLAPWLDLVFTVMGGQMAALGVTIFAIAVRLLRPFGRNRLETIALGLAGLASAGVMSLTNFVLGSDFKWPLLVPVILWVLAISLTIATPAARPLGSR